MRNIYLSSAASVATPGAGINSEASNADRILSKAETARVAGISIRSLERHESEGTAPPRVQLGIRRVGYWQTDVYDWLRARTAPKKAA